MGNENQDDQAQKYTFDYTDGNGKPKKGWLRAISEAAARELLRKMNFVNPKGKYHMDDKED